MTRAKSPTASRKKGTQKPQVLEHPLSSETEFTNREIGWLHFNSRVLHEAEDSRNPMLERLRFLSIVNSNLDEFFMKRVGGLKRQVAFGISSKSSDGKTQIQLLAEIRTHVLKMVKEQGRVFSEVLKPSLKHKGIVLLKWNELTVKEREQAQQYYLKNVSPVLTPLSVDPGHPFPFISNLSTSLGVTLTHPQKDEKLFARVKIPKVLPQWVRLDAEKTKDVRFVSLVEMIKENLHDLFPSMKVQDVMPFRLTRNADIFRDEEDAEDLISMIEEELRMRRFAEVVRLEHGPHPDPWILKFLTDELEITEQDIYELPEELDLDYRGLEVVADLPNPELRYEPWHPIVPHGFQEDDPEYIFAMIRKKDRLLHHPYESFPGTIEKLIRMAAEDPKVVAIKMTLYRTGDNSPFIKSLIRAAEEGKQVVCLVELKARFDEERNIYWAQELENAGVHVVYGVVGLKTHAKTTLFVRQEAEGLKCYAHIGTGNYNVSTSRLYTDFGLLTAHSELTDELSHFFHYLTGRSLKSDYKHLLVAPVNMFQRFKYMIDREAEMVRQKKPSKIFVKMNSMEENDIAMALYNASQTGVDVTMVVRGFCCVRPGVKGLSERLRVISLIGRFLEHSRVFYFRNGAQDPLDGEFYIGSADWMYRNLHARVECVTPIYDRSIRQQLWDYIQMCEKDQRQAWDMGADGSYKQRQGQDIGLHQTLMNQARSSAHLTEESDGNENS